MSGWAIAAGAVLGGVSSYMGAKEQNKAAKEAAKPKPYESYRTPYMNEYLSQYAPWLMAMQQKIFESRLKTYGLDPAQFGLGPLGGVLAGIPNAYSGVGKPGSPVLAAGGYNANAVNPFSQYAIQPRPVVQLTPEQIATMQARREARGFSGIDRGGMRGGM